MSDQNQTDFKYENIIIELAKNISDIASKDDTFPGYFDENGSLNLAGNKCDNMISHYRNMIDNIKQGKQFKDFVKILYNIYDASTIEVKSEIETFKEIQKSHVLLKIMGQYTENNKSEYYNAMKSMVCKQVVYYTISKYVKNIKDDLKDELTLLVDETPCKDVIVIDDSFSSDFVGYSLRNITLNKVAEHFIKVFGIYYKCYEIILNKKKTEQHIFLYDNSICMYRELSGDDFNMNISKCLESMYNKIFNVIPDIDSKVMDKLIRCSDNNSVANKVFSVMKNSIRDDTFFIDSLKYKYVPNCFPIYNNMYIKVTENSILLLKRNKNIAFVLTDSMKESMLLKLNLGDQELNLTDYFTNIANNLISNKFTTDSKYIKSKFYRYFNDITQKKKLVNDSYVVDADEQEKFKNKILLMLGICMSFKPIRGFFYLYSDSRGSGKTTLLEMLTHLFQGLSRPTNPIIFQSRTSHQSEALQGKYACCLYADDVSFDFSPDVGVVQNLTGGAAKTNAGRGACEVEINLFKNITTYCIATNFIISSIINSPLLHRVKFLHFTATCHKEFTDTDKSLSFFNGNDSFSEKMINEYISNELFFILTIYGTYKYLSSTKDGNIENNAISRDIMWDIPQSIKDSKVDYIAIFDKLFNDKVDVINKGFHVNSENFAYLYNKFSQWFKLYTSKQPTSIQYFINEFKNLYKENNGHSGGYNYLMFKFSDLKYNDWMLTNNNSSGFINTKRLNNIINSSSTTDQTQYANININSIDNDKRSNQEFMEDKIGYL